MAKDNASGGLHLFQCVNRNFRVEKLKNPGFYSVSLKRADKKKCGWRWPVRRSKAFISIRSGRLKRFASSPECRTAASSQSLRFPLRPSDGFPASCHCANRRQPPHFKRQKPNISDALKRTANRTSGEMPPVAIFPHKAEKGRSPLIAKRASYGNGAKKSRKGKIRENKLSVIPQKNSISTKTQPTPHLKQYGVGSLWQGQKDLNYIHAVFLRKMYEIPYFSTLSACRFRKMR